MQKLWFSKPKLGIGIKNISFHPKTKIVIIQMVFTDIFINKIIFKTFEFLIPNVNICFSVRAAPGFRQNY